MRLAALAAALFATPVALDTRIARAITPKTSGEQVIVDLMAEVPADRP